VSRSALGLAQPPIHWVLRLCLEVKQPGHGADNSSQLNVEVKNVSGYTITLPNIFIASCLIKARGNLLFCLLKKYHGAF
jgi:hypothetical protein